jgi:glycosyltransferase involved in cell wall biosynthesis
LKTSGARGIAAGVPVIVSDVCDAADVISRSGCGRVVRARSAKALEEAISWAARLTLHEREHLREKALGVAKQLIVTKLADVLLSHCEEVLRLVKSNMTSLTDQSSLIGDKSEGSLL